ncbi:MAG: hypothetical protein ACXAC5_07695 [Promethearchaeota archaeon]|jgi:hypothetical protein
MTENETDAVSLNSDESKRIKTILKQRFILSLLILIIGATIATVFYILLYLESIGYALLWDVTAEMRILIGILIPVLFGIIGLFGILRNKIKPAKTRERLKNKKIRKYKTSHIFSMILGSIILALGISLTLYYKIDAEIQFLQHGSINSSTPSMLMALTGLLILGVGVTLYGIKRLFKKNTTKSSLYILIGIILTTLSLFLFYFDLGYPFGDASLFPFIVYFMMGSILAVSGIVKLIKKKSLRGPLLAIAGSILVLVCGTIYFYFNDCCTTDFISYQTLMAGRTLQEAELNRLTLVVVMYIAVALGIFGAITAAIGNKIGNYVVILGGLIAFFLLTGYLLLFGIYVAPNLLLQLYPWNLILWLGQAMLLAGGILGRRILNG